MYSVSESAISNKIKDVGISTSSSPNITINDVQKTEDVKIQTANNNNEFTIKLRKLRRKKNKFVSKVMQVLNRSCRSTQYPSQQNIRYSSPTKRVPKTLSAHRPTKSARSDKTKEMADAQNKFNIKQDAKYWKIIKNNKELVVLRDKEADNEKVEYINDIHKSIAEGLHKNKQKFFAKQKSQSDQNQVKTKEKSVEFNLESKAKEDDEPMHKESKFSIKEDFDKVIRRKRKNSFCLKTLTQDVIISNPSPKFEEEKTTLFEPSKRRTKKEKRLEKERNIILGILAKDLDNILPPRNMYESLKLIALKRRQLLTSDVTNDKNAKLRKEYLEKHYFAY